MRDLSGVCHFEHKRKYNFNDFIICHAGYTQLTLGYALNSNNSIRLSNKL